MVDVPKVDIKKILYVTDLSETGRYAFSYAASMARCYGASLTVFHVLDEGPDMDKRLEGYITEDLWEKIKTRDLAEARAMITERKRDDAAIRDMLDAAFVKESYITYDVDVRLGSPVLEIVKKAAEEDYDMIVIGSHGHSTLPDAVRVMLGDVVRNVLRRATVPVMVVRAPD